MVPEAVGRFQLLYADNNNNYRDFKSKHRCVFEPDEFSQGAQC